jgi:RNA polymerase sigma-70 factor, ECF subfamily
MGVCSSSVLKFRAINIRKPRIFAPGVCPDPLLTSVHVSGLLVKVIFLGNHPPVNTSYKSEMRTEGEPDFTELVELYYAPLYRFAVSLTHAESDACDLVQETFSKWAVKGHQLQDRSKVKSWLFTTLHRRFLETQRRSTRFPHFEIDDSHDELPHIDPELVNRIDAQSLVAMLSRVEPVFQAPVALFYLEDYSYNEIAEILDVPLGTVKSRIARGLGELKLLFLKPPAAGGRKEAR